MIDRRLDELRRVPAGSRLPLAIGLLVVGAWSLWFVRARVAIYESSLEAHLEVAGAASPVDSPVEARVLGSHVELGQVVGEGDVLLELDAEALRLERAREQARLAALVPQSDALERQLAQDRHALQEELASLRASLVEAGARRAAADALAALSLAERGQLERLVGQEHVARVEADRIRAESDRRLAETEALRAAMERLGSERRARRSERLSQMARREQELAALRGQQAELAARLSELDQRIGLYSVRAPVRGRVGDLRPLRRGAMVAAGQRLLTLVPLDLPVRAVARFPARAIGRVRPGQPARLRMEGFPWTKFGTLPARVASVGSAPDAGGVRVELDILPGASSRIPRGHGMPGQVEVEVGRVSPATLALDATGRLLDGQVAPAAPP